MLKLVLGLLKYELLLHDQITNLAAGLAICVVE